MSSLGKYSFGMGDRFAHQAMAQLKAIKLAEQVGVHITPVWNKSYREHKTIGSRSEQTRLAADQAVKELQWESAYFTDADHINSSNVDFFLDSCDFFTIDVADYIGKSCETEVQNKFVDENRKYIGKLDVHGLEGDLVVTEALLSRVAQNYLYAAIEAGKLYRYIATHKPGAQPIIEVSMDETNEAQTPGVIFLILAALASQGVPVDTIAPKFTGRFNKGVDYNGNLEQFRQEFEQDVAVLQLAIQEFKFDPKLKLSIHSGSDKFSIYPTIKEVIRKYDAGLHVKTAGTTWLEELIGLAEAGEDGLQIARDIYEQSMTRFEELCSPYATVLDIDPGKLPAVEAVNTWDSETFANTLRHVQTEKRYNLHFRQLLHVGYKIAAEMGERYLQALEKHADVVGEHVTTNLFERHIKRLFL